MPALHNRERDTSDYRDQRRSQDQEDREISLGTGTILTIFFALALVCAVFFGLGYSMGRKSAQSAVIAATASEPAPSSSTFSNFKPAAGNTSNQSSNAALKKDSAAANPPADPDSQIVTTPVTSAQEEVPQPVRPTHKVTAQEAAPIVREVPREISRPTPTPSQTPVMPAINPNGTSMVQVAAVSHQEDADVLLSALKKRGYAVFIRQESQDHLLHGQVGPFANRKDADAMRQRLLSDGYNAIVK